MQHPGGYAGDVRRPDGLEQEVLGAFFHAPEEKVDRDSDRRRGLSSVSIYQQEGDIKDWQWHRLVQEQTC